tara:strand:+ start:16784 stop:17158 length:375 start_codon:yes stop_codon:yes gene_type:complete
VLLPSIAAQARQRLWSCVAEYVNIAKHWLDSCGHGVEGLEFQSSNFEWWSCFFSFKILYDFIFVPCDQAANFHTNGKRTGRGQKAAQTLHSLIDGEKNLAVQNFSDHRHRTCDVDLQFRRQLIT